MSGSAFYHPANCVLKAWLVGHGAVQSMAVVVVLVITLRPSAKREAKEDIGQPASLNRPLQLIAIEMRRVARIGIRPDVEQVGQVVLIHDPKKFLDLVVGVTNCPDGALGRHRGHGTPTSRQHAWLASAAVTAVFRDTMARERKKPGICRASRHAPTRNRT
jgi:hypothetical protein